MATIEDKEYSLLWDIDRSSLSSLGFAGRTDWLQQRIQLVLLNPIEVLVESEQKPFPWLASTALVCDGIEALSGFYSDGRYGKDSSSNTKPFCRFVHAFMHSNYSMEARNSKGEMWTFCQHLQEYFRNGLGHGFSVEWGGLWYSDDRNQQPGYLRPAQDGRGIAICPRALLEDLQRAAESYFAKLRTEGENSLIGQNFQERFNAILQQRGKTR
jgi:hypothetical protein